MEKSETQKPICIECAFCVSWNEFMYGGTFPAVGGQLHCTNKKSKITNFTTGNRCCSENNEKGNCQHSIKRDFETQGKIKLTVPDKPSNFRDTL